MKSTSKRQYVESTYFINGFLMKFILFPSWFVYVDLIRSITTTHVDSCIYTSAFVKRTRSNEGTANEGDAVKAAPAEI